VSAQKCRGGLLSPLHFQYISEEGKMKHHNPFRRHAMTKYIQVNTRFCEACWDCLDACPNQVLGKIEIGPHRHIRINASENCKGCKKCVQACPNHAIEYVYQSKRQAEVQAI
jgi:uncharacterized Fe-S center protein